MSQKLKRVQADISKMIEKGASVDEVKLILADQGFTYPEYLRKSQRLAKAGGKIVEAGWGRLLAQGLSLGFADEIEAFVKSLKGDDYGQTVQAIRNGIADYREDNATGAFAAEMTGAAIPTLAAIIAAPFTGGSSTAAVAPSLAKLVGQGLKAGATTGGISGVGAAEGGPKERLKGGVVGATVGGLTGGATPVVTKTATGAYQALKPLFSQRRQAEVVGDVLNQAATNPSRAASNMATAREIVPGSQPTTAQVAGDPGIAGLQTPIRSGFDPDNRIAQRLSEQNTARQGVLERISGGSEETIERATQKRSRVTGPMRETAFDESLIPDEIIPSGYTLTVTKKIDDLLKTPEGKRKTVSDALTQVRKEIKKADNVRDLYAIRKDIRLRSLGKLNRDQSTDKFAKGQLEQVIKEIDNVIESAAPGYQAYMNRFSQMSKPIEQMKVLQDIRRKSELSGPDVTTGENVLSQAQFKRQLRRPDLLDKTGKPKLSASQTRQVNDILRDLNRSTAPTAPNVKVPGSDTAKNLTVANMLGRSLSNPDSAIGRQLAGTFGWMYRMPEEKVRGLLVDAMLDPKLASNLMKSASNSNKDRVAKALKSKARNLGLSTSAGTASGLLMNQ